MRECVGQSIVAEPPQLVGRGSLSQDPHQYSEISGEKVCVCVCVCVCRCVCV